MSENKLLKTLIVLGVATSVTVGHSQAAMAHDLGQREMIDAGTQATVDEVMAKVEFLRAFPESPLAAKVATELAALLQALPPSVRASVVSQIGATGGLPEVIATMLGLPSTPSASVEAVEGSSSIY